MSAFSTIGIVLVVCAGILFAYQVLEAFLSMGSSDEFLYENINLENILPENLLDTVDGISSATLQGLAYTVITMPLVLLLLSGALIFFLIHMSKGHKHK